MREFAVGIVTYNRPRFAAKSVRAAAAAFLPLGAPLFVYNDGSEPKYRGEYRRLSDRHPAVQFIEDPENHGVAYAKNRLLEKMLKDTDAEWLFLLEDDIIVKSAEAATEYIRIAEQQGEHHLSFAHHGDANLGPPVDTDGELNFYWHSVGAWTMFSRECLETVGLLDENFQNAWEHVEHELRIIQAGLMPDSDAHRYPDAAGSEAWLSEIPASIAKSSIRPRDDWQSSIINGLRYWQENKPETFEMLFGPGTPLEQYSRHTLALDIIC